MKRLLKTLIFFSLLVLFVFTGASVKAGKERVIPLDRVPGALLEKAKELVPNAEFSTADIEIEDDGTLVYEIQGVLEDGRRVEVDLYEDGKVQEIEVEFTKDHVPGAVMKAVESKYPGFEPTFIEASHSKSKKVTRYEFTGEQDGKKLDFDVSANGRKIVKADK